MKDANESEISTTKWMSENAAAPTENWGGSDYEIQILCQIELNQEYKIESFKKCMN